MNAVADCIEDTIRLELDQARVDLAYAVLAERTGHDPAAPGRVLACRAHMDAALDMWNAAEHGG